ncbi:MAG: hypothetical protein JW915_05795 [Chitinispirillaceae bacterium]|nr:hypothetical protein [Chitinispirillaceae bacterium]
MNSHPNCPLFLVNAEIRDGAIVPGTVHPFLFQDLMIKGIDAGSGTAKNKNYKSGSMFHAYCRTDGAGRIGYMNKAGEKMTSFLMGIPKAKKEIYFLSRDAVMASLYLTPDGGSKNWKENLQDLLASELKPDEKVVLEAYPFTVEDLSSNAFDRYPDDVKGQYMALIATGKTNIALVLPSQRHLVIIVDQSTLITNVKTSTGIINGDNFKLRFQEFSIFKNGANETLKLPCFTISLPAEQLPTGLYTITVRSKSGTSYKDTVTGAPTATYSLTVKADFAMQTPIGSMDIVNGCPVSLEEVLLLHYPAEYVHLTTALMSTDTVADSSDKNPFSAAKGALIHGINVAKVIKEKHDYVKDKVEYEKKKAFTDLIDVIGKECPAVLTSYKLYTGYVKAFGKVKKIYDTWTLNTKLFKVIDALENLSEVKKRYYCTLGIKLFNAHGDKVLQHVLSDKVFNKKVALKLLTTSDDSLKFNFLMTTDGPYEKISDMHKGKFSKGYSKALEGVNLAFSAYDTIMAFSTFWQASDSCEKEKEKYQRILKEVSALKLSAPSREIMATIIKGRTGVDKLSQGADQAMVQAVWSSFDLLCSVGSLTPAAPVLNALKFIIGTGTALKMAYLNTENFIEEMFPSCFLSELTRQRRISSQMYNDLNTNFKLLSEKPPEGSDSAATDLFVQSRICYETIRSLMALIQRISCRLYTKTSTQTDPQSGESTCTVDYGVFDRKVVQYGIEEFVNRFIFDSGWLYPQSMSCPVGLDTIWSYMKWEKKALTQGSTFNPMDTISQRGIYFGSKPGSSNGEVPGHWKADFKKSLPVHTIASSSLVTMAHIFSQNYSGAYKFIRWTQVYYRERPENDVGLSINEGWKPLSEVASIPGKISTNTQLRVVIIFDGGIDLRAVPMSLKLYRFEFFKDIAGPEYKFTPSILDVSEGGLLEGEAQYKNKLGVVFFPFYTFGGEMHYGVRPMEADSTVWDAVTKMLWKGSVEMPNSYGFTLKIGNTRVPLYFGENFIDYSKENKLYLNLYQVNPLKDFIPALGKQSLLFSLDKSRKTDGNMLRSQGFLNTKDSADEKMPSLVARSGHAGVAGIFVHNEEQGEYFSMGAWKNRGTSPEMVKNNEKIVLPSSLFKQDSLKMSIILYVTIVNDVEFVRSAGFIHAWTATPCKLNVRETALIHSPLKQIIPGTLHFLGYGTKIKSEGSCGFQLRRIRTSVDTENMTVNMEQNIIKEIEETPPFTNDLKTLLSWGNKDNNFDRHLFADPGLHWESAFFAADFDFFWDDAGKVKKGLHKEFKSGDAMSLKIDICGCENVKVDRKCII